MLQAHGSDMDFLNTVFGFMQRKTGCFSGPEAEKNFQTLINTFTVQLGELKKARQKKAQGVDEDDEELPQIMSEKVKKDLEEEKKRKEEAAKQAEAINSPSAVTLIAPDSDHDFEPRIGFEGGDGILPCCPVHYLSLSKPSAP